MTTRESDFRSEFEVWAENELHRAGLFDKDSDYDGMLGDSVLGLVSHFAAQGHSGFSARYASHLFGQLVERRPLTPLTDDSDEWMEISEEMMGRPGCWQSRRMPSAFSTDGGKTYYDVNEPLTWWRRALEGVARLLRFYRPWQFAKKYHTHVSGE